MPGYLYRRTGNPAQAPWQTGSQGGVTPDAGTTPAPVSPSLPQRPMAPLRAAAAAFVVLLARPPMDAGSAPVPSAMPDRVPAARRAAPQAYTIATGTPGDSGASVSSWPISDTFTDAAGTLLSAHTPDTGGAWTLHPSYSGTAIMDAANRLRQTTTTAACYYVAVAPNSADYDVTADLNRLSSSAFPSTVGVCGRLDTSADTCYTLRQELQGSNWALYKRVAATETSLGTSSTPSIVVGTPNTATLRMVGTTIQAIVDGVVRITVTDSAISAAGRAGVRFTGVTASPTDTTLIHLDNFAANDVPSPVYPPQPQPDRASAARRAASSSYSLVVPPPPDSGLVAAPAIDPSYPDSARGRPRSSPSAYEFPRTPPPDSGDVSAPAEAPDLARGRARASASAYAVLVAPPPDAGDTAVPAGIMPDRAASTARAASRAYAFGAGTPPEDSSGFVGVRGGRKSRYLYRRDVEPAPYRLIVLPPMDPPAAQDPAIPAEAPDRTQGPRRAASEAYRIAPPIPPDAGDPCIPTEAPDRVPARARAVSSAYLISVPPPQVIADVSVPPEMPDRASGPRRAATPAYLFAQPVPPDSGDAASPSEMPDAARGRARAAASAYAMVVPPPPDSGVAAVAPPISPTYPDSARGPIRGRTPTTPLSATPADAGDASSPAEYPDVARGRARAAAHAYLVATGTPPDPGTPSSPTSAPDRAAGPKRSASHAYSVLVPSPVDAGVVLVPPSVPAEYPDSAPGKRRAAASAYVLLVSATPGDAGQSPIPASWPSRADRPRLAGNAAYRILTGTPPDQGSVPGPIRPQYPDRAPGRRRTSPEAYSVLVPSPVDTGVLAGYRIYANTGAGDPINYAASVGSTTLLTWTSGVLGYPDQWKFGVRAYDAVAGLEERNVDAVVRLRLDAAGADVTAMPDPPTGLSGVARAAGSIRLDWSYALVDVDRAPTGFRVYRGTGGTPSYVTPVATVAYTRGVVNFSGTVTGGSNGVAYTFGVRAYNATGEESNVLKATVTAAAVGPASVAGLSGGATT